MAAEPDEVGSADFSHSGFLAQRYFPSFDGLRALSILPVVWHHSTPRPYPGLLGRGPIGVDLFFAISGFLITTLLVREREQRGRIDLSAFYVRRSCRIFPLYYLVFALYVLYANLVRPEPESSRIFRDGWVVFATYTANWQQFAGPSLFAFAWSLCTEEQFYAFWAPLMRWAKRLWMAGLCMATWLGLDVWLESGTCPLSGLLPPLLSTILHSFASPIGFGALLALAAHHRRLGPWLGWLFGRRSSAILVGLGVVLLIVWPVAPLVVLHLGLGLLTLCCALRPDHGLSRCLGPAPLQFIGKVSYGIYLWHVSVIAALVRLVPALHARPFLLFVLAFPLAVGVAALSYRYFERPFLALGARWQRR